VTLLRIAISMKWLRVNWSAKQYQFEPHCAVTRGSDVACLVLVFRNFLLGSKRNFSCGCDRFWQIIDIALSLEDNFAVLFGWWSARCGN